MDILDSIVSRYQGEGRLQRLLFVAQTAATASASAASHNDPDRNQLDALAREAYEAALHQIQQAGNVVRYKELYQQAPPPPHQQQQQPLSSSLQHSTDERDGDDLDDLLY